MLDDAVGMKIFDAAAALDDDLNPLHGMGRQELQNTDELAGAVGVAVTLFQPLT